MKLVLFDCDGTIVDSQHHIVSAMTEAFAANGLVPPARERVLTVVGLSLVNAVSGLLDEQGRALAPKVAEDYKLAFQALRRTGPAEPLYPLAAETIRSLASRDDLVLGIVTGKSRRGLEAVLGHHGLRKLFLTVQTADDAPSKPDPAMVERGAAETGIHVRDAVVVGDTTFDVTMARTAGARAIGVSWGYHAGPALEAAGAHRLISGYEHLESAIDEIWMDA